MQSDLLILVRAFLAETGMGASYFGKRACGNSELVERLAQGRPVLNSTEQRVRSFMAAERQRRSPTPDLPAVWRESA